MKRASLFFAVFLGLLSTAYTQSVDGALKTLTASGTNTYTISEPLPAAYSNKERFLVRFTNTNTAAATLNRNSLGARAIKKADGSDLVSGDLLPGAVYLLSYNGTFYQIVGDGGGSGSGTINFAKNGLYLDGDTVKLGGSLTENTTISGGHNFSVDLSVEDGSPSISLKSTDTNSGFYSEFLNSVFGGLKIRNNFTIPGLLELSNSNMEFSFGDSEFYGDGSLTAMSLGSKIFRFTTSGTELDLGSDATGDIYRRNSSGYLSRLALGSALQVLRVNSGGTDIEWAAPSGYTDEQAQDAVGAMVDASLTYVDGTPLLQRAALTGAITASAGSNSTALGSYTSDALSSGISDKSRSVSTADDIDQADNGRVIYFNGSSTFDFTIEPLTDETSVFFYNNGTADVTLVASGVTLNGNTVIPPGGQAGIQYESTTNVIIFNGNVSKGGTVIVSGTYSGGSSSINIYDGNNLSNGESIRMEVNVVATQSSGTVGASGFSYTLKSGFRKSSGTLTQIGTSTLSDTYNDTGDSFSVQTLDVNIGGSNVNLNINMSTSKTFNYSFYVTVYKN